jgi:hypothetical protein
MLDLNRGAPVLGTNHASSGDQFQRDCAVELRWPADRDFNVFARDDAAIRSEQYAIAAKVDRLPAATFISALAVENFKADFPFDGEAVGVSAIALLWIQVHISPWRFHRYTQIAAARGSQQ